MDCIWHTNRHRMWRQIVQVMRWINDLNFSMLMMYRYNYYCIWWIMMMHNRCPMIDRVNDFPNVNVYWLMWWDQWAVYDYRVQCLFVSTMMMGLMLRRRFVCYLLQIGYWMKLMNHLRNDDTMCQMWYSIGDSQYRPLQYYCWMWCAAQSLIFGTMCLATMTNMYYFLLSDMMRSAYYIQSPRSSTGCDCLAP